MHPKRMYHIHQLQTAFGADFERMADEILSGRAGVSPISAGDREILGLEDPGDQEGGIAGGGNRDLSGATAAARGPREPGPENGKRSGRAGKRRPVMDLSDSERAEISAALDFLTLEQVDRLLDHGFLNLNAVRNHRIRLAFSYLKTRMPAKLAVETLAEQFHLGRERVKDIVYKGA